MQLNILSILAKKNKNMQAKPFLKWAGGKSQLIKDIVKLFPKDFDTYIEPFVGSGAILFGVLNNFPNLKKIIINDINFDLINTYEIISSNPINLIQTLEILQNEFYLFEFEDLKRKEYYLSKRALFNLRISDKIMQAALFLFLNKTCFNGLYRVNKKNEFNVPIGSYIKPLICDSKNLLAVSIALRKVKILKGDYKETIKQAKHKTLFYLDPPYKPLIKN